MRAGASVGIGRSSESVSAAGPPDELETMLQLVTLQFTQPRFTTEGLERYRRNREESLRNRLTNPGAVFEDAFDALMWEPGVRSQPWTVDTLSQLDLAASEAFYEARFANAADFTWMMAGNLDLDAVEPLILRYLGNLPTSEAREDWTDDGMHRTTGRFEQTVRAGLEPRATVKMTWHGPFESTWTSRNRLVALEDILSDRLRVVMREDLGGVYGVGVSSNSWERPTHGYSFTISFTCDPERVDELTAAALAGVQGVVDEPVTAEEIEVEKAKNRRGREEAVRTNGFWVSGILGTLDRGEDPRDLLGYEARNESLNPAEVQALAQQVFAPEANLVHVVLLPEAPKEAAE